MNGAICFCGARYTPLSDVKRLSRQNPNGFTIVEMLASLVILSLTLVIVNGLMRDLIHAEQHLSNDAVMHINTLRHARLLLDFNQISSSQQTREKEGRLTTYAHDYVVSEVTTLNENGRNVGYIVSRDCRRQSCTSTHKVSNLALSAQTTEEISPRVGKLTMQRSGQVERLFRAQPIVTSTRPCNYDPDAGECRGR